MAISITIALITAILMVIAVLVKPYAKIYKFNVGVYWVICLVGALAMLIFGAIDFSSVINGITANTSVNPIKILTLFLSMTLISVYLGDTGFFDYIANNVFIKSKGAGYKLFILLYLVVAILTIFTSNDIIILTFTPPICIFAKKAKISPLPYLFGEFIAANTWSMALIIGNPTNIYIAQSAGIGFYQYFSVMWLPALVGGLTSLALLLLIFRKQLSCPITATNEDDNLLQVKSHKKRVSKLPMLVSLSHLILAIILLAFSDIIGIEMYLICLILAISLTLFLGVYDLIKLHTIFPVVESIKKEPFELIPFVLSMFTIVLALNKNGVTGALSNFLLTNTKADSIVFGGLSCLLANLLNNIPMSVLFERIVDFSNLYSVYGSIIGSNIGAFLTPVGALAGIMWTKILGKYDVKLSFKKFVFYGGAVAIPTVIACSLSLLLVI